MSSKRKILIVVGLLVFLMAGEFAILSFLWHRPSAAVIECRATNADVPLSSDDGRVFLYHAGHHGGAVAEGKLEEPIEVPPGRYDVRVLFVRSRDQQTRWLKNIVLVSAALTIGATVRGGGLIDDPEVFDAIGERSGNRL